MKNRYVFPFVATLGQEKFKKALLLNVINPGIGGVIISGEKGTAKSTLVRGLAKVVRGIEVVELPLNVTEDRLLGTINFEKAVKEGSRTFDPGILKKADGNILYVDEINLLSEYIVNCLLEVSASHINRVEREGISYCHESRFILIGTMNPEEGLLKPHFLDRFGLYVETKGCEDIETRKEIIRRRLEYEKSPSLFIEKWKDETNRLFEKIEASRALLPEISALDTHMEYAAEIASEGNCHGHRAEIVLIETAKAIAAFEGRKGMLKEDIAEAARFVLPHRIREKRKAVEGKDPGSGQNHSNETRGEKDQEVALTEEQKQPSVEKESTGAYQEKAQTYLENTLQSISNQCNEKRDEPEDIFEISLSVDQMTDQKKRRGSGRKNKTITDSGQGRYIRYTFPKGKAKSIAFDASLRAAAPYQITRDKKGMAIAMKASDLREKVCEKRTGAIILFVVDASGSMGAGKRMGTVKGAILSLLNDAYQKRDKVGMIAFRKNGAEVLLDITRSVDLAQKQLKELPTGGKTPLASGLYKAYELLRAAKRKDPNIFPLLVLLSDGRANVSLNGEDAVKEAFDAAKCISAEGIKSLVIDTESGRIRFGLASEISSHLGATYHKIDHLTDCKLEQAVRNILI